MSDALWWFLAGVVSCAYIFGIGAIIACFVPRKRATSQPASQAEQVRPEPAIDDLDTKPLPSIKVWPFADYMTYEPEVHGACVFCGGTQQRKGASLQ